MVIWIGLLEAGRLTKIIQRQRSGSDFCEQVCQGGALPIFVLALPIFVDAPCFLWRSLCFVVLLILLAAPCSFFFFAFLIFFVLPIFLVLPIGSGAPYYLGAPFYPLVLTSSLGVF